MFTRFGDYCLHFLQFNEAHYQASFSMDFLHGSLKGSSSLGLTLPKVSVAPLYYPPFQKALMA